MGIGTTPLTSFILDGAATPVSKDTDTPANTVPLPVEIDGTITTVSGAASTGGRVTVVALDAVSWTPLPATPLADRLCIAVQNVSGIEVKLGYDDGEAGYVGVVLADDGERQYDIGPEIVLYAKAASGTPSVTVEEIA